MVVLEHLAATDQYVLLGLSYGLERLERIRAVILGELSDSSRHVSYDTRVSLRR